MFFLQKKKFSPPQKESHASWKFTWSRDCNDRKLSELQLTGPFKYGRISTNLGVKK